MSALPDIAQFSEWAPDVAPMNLWLRGIAGSGASKGDFQATISAFSHPTEYSVVVQNPDTTAVTGGRGFQVLGSDGVNRLSASDVGVAVGNALGVTGAITSLSAVQGTQLISTATGSFPATGSPPLVVASTRKVANLNADLLDDHDSAYFATAASLASYVLKAGDTISGLLTLEPSTPTEQALKLKYGSTTGGFFLGASNAADPVLVFRDNSGDQTFEIGNSASTYQAKATGDFNVTDDAVIGGDLTASGAVLFDGATVHVTGAATFDGAVTLGDVAGDAITVTGAATFGQTANFSANISVQGGTAGQVRAGVVIVGAASLSGTEELRVVGQSRLEGAVVVTTGGADITGSSIFQSGLTVAGGLAVTTGDVTLPNTNLGCFGSAANSKQTVTGAKALNAALGSLLSALVNYGLIVDSTTA